jgi:hypothetical protein
VITGTGDGGARGNPSWLWVAPTYGERGWMAGYIDNVTNWIDDVPDC